MRQSVASEPNSRAPLFSLLLLAGALSGGMFVLADALQRSTWAEVALLPHFISALGLYAAAGTCLALGIALLLAFERRVVQRLPSRLQWGFVPAFYALVGFCASSGTAFWTFSGSRASSSKWALLGPLVFMAACGACAGAGAAVLRQVAAKNLPNTSQRTLAAAIPCALLGSVLAYWDLRWMVALYVRVHTVAELIAALLWGACFTLLLLHFAERKPPYVSALRYLSYALLVWLAACLGWSGMRMRMDSALTHVWQEEVYIGRMLRRAQVAEAFFADPLHWNGIFMAQVARLKKRYGLFSSQLTSDWQSALAEEPEQKQAIDKLRGPALRYNIILYYVDTLRYDVANDSRIMPELRKFARTSVEFSHAYAAGSDTLRSLPALTAGSYDAAYAAENGLLATAKQAGYKSTLVVARSAWEFIHKQAPTFRFDHVVDIPDYPEERKVWGYGAEYPTATAVADRGLAELAQSDKADAQPFLLWLFQFDVHNWQQLDKPHIENLSDRYLPTQEKFVLPRGYLATAASVDHEFGRVLSALECSGLAKNTLLVFLSDHGEALGERGFDVHSVFLWENLVRVPLLLRAPGLAEKRVDSRVSLVDLAPTLGRYVTERLDTRGYHGQDLLGYLLPIEPKRRLPILLVSSAKEQVVRLGLVDEKRGYKVVASLESALAEYYDLAQPQPDQVNFAKLRQPEVLAALQQLAASPIFPRPRALP